MSQPSNVHEYRFFRFETVTRDDVDATGSSGSRSSSKSDSELEVRSFSGEDEDERCSTNPVSGPRLRFLKTTVEENEVILRLWEDNIHHPVRSKKGPKWNI